MYRNNTWLSCVEGHCSVTPKHRVCVCVCVCLCVCVCVGAVTKRTLHQFGGIDSRPKSVLFFWFEGCEMDERVFCYDSHLRQR